MCDKATETNIFFKLDKRVYTDLIFSLSSNNLIDDLVTCLSVSCCFHVCSLMPLITE